MDLRRIKNVIRNGLTNKKIFEDDYAANLFKQPICPCQEMINLFLIYILKSYIKIIDIKVTLKS